MKEKKNMMTGAQKKKNEEKKTLVPVSPFGN